MTHKKTHKETESMPSAAKKLAIVPNVEPAPEPAVEAVPEPAARPEELRLLEALLFAAGEPLDEASLGQRLPDGADVKEALAEARFVERLAGGKQQGFQ